MTDLDHTTDRLVWFDGRLLAPRDALLPAHDHGIVVGDGAFETLRVVEGVAFATTRHLRRLRRTLEALAILAPDEADIRAGMHAVIEANHLTAGKLRLTVTAGDGPLGSGEPIGPARVIMAAEPEAPPPPPRAVTVPWVRNERGALAGLKTTSYAENVRALRRAHGAGAGEALFANTRDELCEGTGTNVFVVIDGRAMTPPLSSGCLAGVTRELLLECVEVIETPLPMSVLGEADEVFLTSSTRNVQAMEVVDDVTYPPAGPVTAACASAFAALVASNLDP